jgi:hypothetical protein
MRWVIPNPCCEINRLNQRLRANESNCSRALEQYGDIFIGIGLRGDGHAKPYVLERPVRSRFRPAICVDLSDRRIVEEARKVIRLADVHVGPLKELQRALWAFRQALERVLRASRHDAEHRRDELEWNVLVKQVAH